MVQEYQQEAHHQNAEHQRRGESAGLQHSGEMHDTVDIFLSSEELSQGQVYVIIVSQPFTGWYTFHYIV